MAAYKSDRLTEIVTKATGIFNKYRTNREVYRDLDEIFRLGTLQGRELQSLDYMTAMQKEHAKVKKLKV